MFQSQKPLDRGRRPAAARAVRGRKRLKKKIIHIYTRTITRKEEEENPFFSSNYLLLCGAADAEIYSEYGQKKKKKKKNWVNDVKGIY